MPSLLRCETRLGDPRDEFDEKAERRSVTSSDGFRPMIPPVHRLLERKMQDAVRLLHATCRQSGFEEGCMVGAIMPGFNDRNGTRPRKGRVAGHQGDKRGLCSAAAGSPLEQANARG